MYRSLKILFFGLLVKPLVFIGLGLNLIGYERLPRSGPAIVAANHNSHLDGLVLMSLYPLSTIHRVRPVAAADYFLANRLLAWFTLNVIGIIPLDRTGAVGRDHLFDGSKTVLDNGDILILFPEGSRGEPERLGQLKKGLFYLLRERPNVACTPVVMHGLGRALPRGEALLVPFNCDVIVGEPLPVVDDADTFVTMLGQSYDELFAQCLTRHEFDEE